MHMRVAAAAVASCLVLHPLHAQQPGEQAVPVEQEPRHHLVFASPELRVLEVGIPAGDTTWLHRHDYDLATVNIRNGPTRTRDVGADWGSVRPRAVGGVNVNEYTGRPTAHVVQSVGEAPYGLTGVENLRDAGWTTFGPIMGAYLTVVAETRGFRAYEVDLPREAVVGHAHEVPVVVVVVTGTLEAQVPGARVSLGTPGQWQVVDAGESHTLRAGATGARAIEIEVR